MDDKELKPPEGLPEAAASATVKIKSAAGFEYLFTMRSNSSKDLLFKMNAMEKHLIENNFTPLSQGNQFAPKPPQKPTRECLLHKVPMKEKTSKTTGKTYYSHWEGTYPNLGGQCFGQGFTYQNNQVRPATPDDIPVRDINDF